MDTEYTELINSHKFVLIMGLIYVIVITVLTDFGITLFRKYKRKLYGVSEMAMASHIISVHNEDYEPADHQLAQEHNAEKLQALIQMALRNDDGFFLKFNEFDGEFRKNLLKMAPDLVSSELEFCALLKLNFDTKEIARFTSISVRAVEGKKYRIRKKLNIGSKEDINIFMVNV